MLGKSVYITNEINGNLIEVNFDDSMFVIRNNNSGNEMTFKLSHVLHCEIREKRRYKIKNKFRIFWGALVCSIILIIIKVAATAKGVVQSGYFSIYNFPYNGNNFIIDFIAGYIVGIPLAIWLDKRNKAYYCKNVSIEVTQMTHDSYFRLIEEPLSIDNSRYKEELQKAEQLCHEINEEIQIRKKK